jgi:putative component of toxin-antitoxin plasmid stabilization module
MKERRSLNVYLAGPVTNCNEKQKTEWRKAIKSKLAALGHQCIDPTDPDHIDWTPLKETVEIDRSDVVIANLWRLSVGTVVGIVQARRKGKPVVLIDPNYLENPLLRHLIGKEFIVNGIDQALNLLPRILDQLGKTVWVKKGSGAREPFSSVKLHDSLNAVCARAHVEDALLPDLVANAVHRAVMKTERNGEIHADQIKLLVFNSLSDIATDNLHENELKKRAVALREAWDEYERIKKDQRWALQQLAEMEQQFAAQAEEIQRLTDQNASCRSEIDDLRRNLRRVERQTVPLNSDTADAAGAEELRKAYANYFPNLSFTDSALTWLLSSDKTDRHTAEGKLRLMNQEQIGGKHEVPGTNPLVWQQDAGHGLRIYFRSESDHRTVIVRLGTKGTQERDYSKLKRKTASTSGS